MSWRRCPSCRTMCDAGKWGASCIICGAPLGEKTLPGSTPAPELLRAAHQDGRTASSSLGAFGFLGILGVLAVMAQQGIASGYKVAVGAVVAIGIVLGAMTERRTAKAGKTGRIVRKGFALFGMIFAAACLLLFGLGILLFAACALGAVKWGID